MSERTNILNFNNVALALDSEGGVGLCNLNLSLAAGELAVVWLAQDQARIPLADAAEGLVVPVQGTVTFLGQDWQTMAADHAAAQRGKIGRVFAGESWLSDLGVDREITLAQRHHTRRAARDIEAEAIQLGRVFGLLGLPRGRPAGVRPTDLQKAAWVRAFLGTPVLILLEHPTRGLPEDAFAPLVKTVHNARQRGGAVLWTTDELPVWNLPELLPAARYRLLGSPAQVVAEENGAD